MLRSSINLLSVLAEIAKTSNNPEIVNAGTAASIAVRLYGAGDLTEQKLDQLANSIQTMVRENREPTPEEWAKLRSRSDTAHDRIQSADLEAGPGGLVSPPPEPHPNEGAEGINLEDKKQQFEVEGAAERDPNAGLDGGDLHEFREEPAELVNHNPDAVGQVYDADAELTDPAIESNDAPDPEGVGANFDIPETNDNEGGEPIPETGSADDPDDNQFAESVEQQ